MTQTRLIAAPAAVTINGQVWSPDGGVAVGGRAWLSNNPIAGTTTPALYQAERYNMTSYAIPVGTVGYYRVTLRMAELYWQAAGKRVFSVSAEGISQLRDIDITAIVGPDTAFDASFVVWVADGTLTLDFTASVDYAKVGSIQIDSVQSMGRTTISAPLMSGSVEPLFGNPMQRDPLSARGGPFGSASVWATDISAAPLAADSAAQVANLAQQVASRYGGTAAFNNGAYADSYYTVSPTQQTVNVIWDDCQHKGYLPYGLTDQFSAVPIPSNAVASSGTDHYMSIYQPSTDTLWAFWEMKKQADGWHACWGGRMEHASTSRGWFWGGFGVAATGLAAQGGVVNIADVQAGSINHALALQVVDAAPWYTFSWPAQRSDGNGASPIPEGTRFRLDPAIDVSSLKLHPVAAMVAKAAQTYGFIVTDRSGAVAVVAEDGGPTVTYSPTSPNPWTALLNGAHSYDVLHGFPWASLQALPKDYGKS